MFKILNKNFKLGQNKGVTFLKITIFVSKLTLEKILNSSNQSYL